MLLQISVKNFRAISEEVTFSMAPSRLKDSNVGRILTASDNSDIQALSAAVIFGKNGGGKSTFTDAIGYLVSVVKDSADSANADSSLPSKPNVLEPGFSEMPTSYRITFSVEGTVYEFSCAFDKKRIHSEQLRVADKTSKYRLLYLRTAEIDSKSSYKFGDALSGRRSAWADLTRENALFLSTAVQSNSVDLSEPYRYLTNYLRVVDAADVHSNRYATSNFCISSPVNKKRVTAFLRAFDINVEDLDLQEENLDDFPLKMFSEEFTSTIRENFAGKFQRVSFVKKAKDGAKIEMGISGESTGTKALFGLAGPIIESLSEGHCLIVDEINQSLHPRVVERLIELFADPKLNQKRAQLIFTTHDTSILSQSRLRRDQIWFMENDGTSAQLIPLSDYSPRKGEALDRGYLGGRYGGLPASNIAELYSVWCDDGEEE